VILSNGGVCTFFGSFGSNENILLNGQEFVSYLIEAREVNLLIKRHPRKWLYLPGFRNRAFLVEPPIDSTVGDQHTTTGTTRVLSFGACKHSTPTGHAHRASPPSGGPVISNRGGGTTSSIAVVRQTTAWWTDGEVLSENDAPCVETRPTPGQISDLAARPHHESGNPHPRFDAPPESRAGIPVFSWLSAKNHSSTRH